MELALPVRRVDVAVFRRNRLDREEVAEPSRLSRVAERPEEDSVEEWRKGDDDVEEWDVGPGRPGLTTFGATGRPGVVGTALFFGDEAGEYDDDDDE